MKRGVDEVPESSHVVAPVTKSLHLIIFVFYIEVNINLFIANILADKI